MYNCPKCGATVADSAVVCDKCGCSLRSEQPSVPPSDETELDSWSPLPIEKEGLAKKYANFGSICVFLSLWFVPEVFGAAAIILGAYSWKMDKTDSRRGLAIVILGTICMIVGINITSFFALGNLLPT